jgi:hypothetical protein
MARRQQAEKPAARSYHPAVLERARINALTRSASAGVAGL